MFGTYIAFPDNPDTCDILDGEVFLAGERVAPGVYRQIGSRREVCLDQEDVLPASLDGRVACYERVQHTWEQVQRRQKDCQPA
jgi:hypothetical protein